MTAADAEANPPPRAPWRRFLPLLVLVVGLGLFFALRLDRYIGWDALRQNRQALLAAVANDPVLTGALFVLLYAVLAALSVPGASFFTLGGGFLFGPWIGGTLALVAATLGATGIFLAARTALGDSLRRRIGPAMAKAEQGFRQNAMSYMLFLRLMPVFPFWMVNLAAAFLAVPLRVFVIGTAVGIIPGTFVYASVGSGLGAVLDVGGKPDLGLILHKEILLPIIALALLSLVPVVYRAVKRRRGEAA
jgi:uncharacterized membrane protein YdjX (TVP38/TMEM64 family)